MGGNQVIIKALTLSVVAGSIFMLSFVEGGHAAGSMASDVRIIHVKPRAEDVYQGIQKRAAKAEKERTKRELEETKAMVKQMAKEQKAYDAKIKAWAKARK